MKINTKETKGADSIKTLLELTKNKKEKLKNRNEKIAKSISKMIEGLKV